MDIKAALAEFIGTFTLVFVRVHWCSGCRLGWRNRRGGPAHGLALLVIVYAWGSVSAAHVNPAVSVRRAGGRTHGLLPRAISYWVAQFVGAAAAAYLLLWLLQPSVTEVWSTRRLAALTPSRLRTRGTC